jgi:hypothetical protein
MMVLKQYNTKETEKFWEIQVFIKLALLYRKLLFLKQQAFQS